MSFSLPHAIQESLVPWLDLPWPLSPSTLFGRTAPVALELGFGNGEYLERNAAAHPDTDFLGVEVSWGSVHRALKRIQTQAIPNAKVAHGDGVYLLRHAVAPDSLDAVVINHPDPWPKSRHHRRRVIQTPFLELLAARLKPGGRVTIATDHAEYGTWIGEHLEAQAALEPVSGTTRVDSIPGRIPTKYERQGRAAGSHIHFFEWRRPPGAAPSALSLTPRMDPMPNVVLEGPLTGELQLDSLPSEGWSAVEGPHTARIRTGRVYRERDGREWLVDTTVEEEGLRQHFALQISRRKDDRLLIKPADMGHPRPTWGVKEAVRRLAAHLAAAHPELSEYASGVGSVGAPDEL